jgi:hypothetical protein
VIPALCLIIPLMAATPVGAQSSDLVTGTYLLSFHTCDSAAHDCPSTPSAHEVNLAESDDGANWTLVEAFEPYLGSVPDVVRRGDTLYIYTPGSVVTFDVGTGEQSATQQVTIAGTGPGFVDPSAILDDDGNIVLFFLYCSEDGTPTHCFGGTGTPDFHIGSATEVPGSDGTEFELNGNRVDLPNGGGTDPDIYFDGTQYVLYISSGTNTTVYFSDSLHGTYSRSTQLTDGKLSNGQGGVPAGYYDPLTYMYWTYAHISSGGAGASVIRRAVHADFASDLSSGEWTTVLDAADLGLASTFSVESPGFALNVAGVESQTHARSVTLSLKRHLRATGAITSDYSACEDGTRVKIQRKRSGSWRTVKATTTNNSGSYSVSVSDKSGRYRAKVASVALDDLHTCDADTSSVKRHAH